MKAILINDDKSLRWDNVPDPAIKDNECLIKINAAALNRADLLQREGNYPPPPGCPEWMGLEVAGVITEMGKTAKESSSLKVGDKVCALLGGGGYAQYVSVRYDMIMPIPKDFSMIEAASIPEAYATSYLNLFLEGKAKSGDTLLVTGGNSGLAGVMIPMAKSFGIRVLATVRKEEYASSVYRFGADRVIVTSKEPLDEALKDEAEKGHPVDIAIDCLGGEIMGKCLPYLSRGARWIMIASLAGNITSVDLKNIYVKNIRIIGSTLRSRPAEVKAEILAMLVKEIYPKIESGEIKPEISRVFPIEEAEKAQDVLYKGGNIGKVVLTVGE